jgi:probable F420-dependent oxidoreductase
MRFVIPTPFSDPVHLVDTARAADEYGYDYVAVPDHVVFPESIDSKYPYSDDGSRIWRPATPWVDPMVAIGAMSSVTSRLRFVTHVFVLSMRNPFLVAKAVSTAAVLSNDRISLGVGVGWMREEFELLGQDFDSRGERTDEAVEVLRLLCRGGMVEHHGRHYDFERLEISPVPAKPVPILVGGRSAGAFQRAARYGDGWIAVLHEFNELASIIAHLRMLRRRFGREGELFEIHGACSEAVDLDGFRRMRDIGVTHAVVVPWIFYGGDSGSMADRREGLERFAGDVIAKLD